MSIYAIMAFNAATDKLKQNVQDSQNIQSKKLQLETSQQELDLNKQLNQAKIKQARNEGMMSDYVGDALEKQLNEQHKAKSDQLDAIGGLQDIAQHKAQTGAVQAAQIASSIHAQDPDVQAHVAGMQGQPADVNPATGGESNQAQMSVAPRIPSLPGMMPDQSQAPQTQAPAAPSPAPAPTQAAAPAAAAPADQGQQGGIDLSPVEQAFGMPKGSMWLNPATMKPEVNPIWKSKVERIQAAQANYDVNQPFRDEVRQDRNVKTAESYLVNALKQRGGAIGLQNNKVDAAIHARALINQYYDPATGQYNISQVPFSELTESMGALLSGQSGSSEGRIAALKQKTAQGDINGMLTYLTGKPSNATSQDAMKQLVEIIDRQGEISEDLRDKAFNKMKELPTFKRLDEDSLQSLKDTQLGNSFKDILKDAPDKQGGGIPSARPAGATHYSPSTKKFYDDQGNVVQ